MVNVSRFDERGATILEHAIVLPVFFLLVLVSVELLRVLYNHTSIQFALTELSRASLVATTGDPGWSSDIDSTMRLRLASLGVPLSGADTLTICPLAVYGTGACARGSISQGAASIPVVYELERRMTLFFKLPGDLTDLTIRARVFARNEPER